MPGEGSSNREALARDFGERLRMLRERRGLSREEFSSRYKVTGIATLELGRREPRLSDILALCDGMKATPNVLLRGFYQRTRKPRKRDAARETARNRALALARVRSRPPRS